MNGNAYFTKVKLFDGDEEVGMLSNNFHNFKGKIFFSADYNYSYNDFLASVSPQVEVEDRGDGSKKITFDQGDGDIGDTNRGYTDHQRIFTKGKQAETQEQRGDKGQHTSHRTEEQKVQQKSDTIEEKPEDESNSVLGGVTTAVKQDVDTVLATCLMELHKALVNLNKA